VQQKGSFVGEKGKKKGEIKGERIKKKVGSLLNRKRNWETDVLWGKNLANLQECTYWSMTKPSGANKKDWCKKNTKETRVGGKWGEISYKKRWDIDNWITKKGGGGWVTMDPPVLFGKAGLSKYP